VPQFALNLAAWEMRRAFAKAAPAEHTTDNVMGPPEKAGGIDGGLRGAGAPNITALPSAGLCS